MDNKEFSYLRKFYASKKFEILTRVIHGNVKILSFKKMLFDITATDLQMKGVA